MTCALSLSLSLSHTHTHTHTHTTHTLSLSLTHTHTLIHAPIVDIGNQFASSWIINVTYSHTRTHTRAHTRTHPHTHAHTQSLSVFHTNANVVDIGNQSGIFAYT